MKKTKAVIFQYFEKINIPTVCKIDLNTGDSE